MLAEVKKALQALVEWTTQHWWDDVELVGEDDLEPMNMIHHDSFGYDHRGEPRAEGDRNSGGCVAGEGAASTPAATTRSAASTPDAPPPEPNRRRSFTTPSTLDQDD